MAKTKLSKKEIEKREITKSYRALLRGFKYELNKGDKSNIRRAFDMAVDAHMDMRRKSGEPYIYHPLAVARIVSEEIGLGPTSVVCALLHDVVEDTEITLEDIENSFNRECASIIDGLTKISGVFDLNSSLQAENFRKLLLTITDDIRVILIKIADRLHNMRTLDSMPKHKQLKIASETMYLYAPLAHRMGLYAIKTELEDLSMKFTENRVYKDIAKKLADRKRERSKYINEFIKPVKELLDQKSFNYDIFGRPKSIYSIWNKMKSKDVEFDEVYDLFAIRIILRSELGKEKDDCWKVYSTITDVYRPNPDRLRDWISNPKANGYEALHTTVMGPKGRWVEVQIRSERMHEIAEKGLAAHWKYKNSQDNDSALDEWISKIQNLLNNPDSNAIDFINDFKQDLFSEEIFAFTPKGDLKRLRNGATALDFAFEIHSQIGRKCIGAKVNHKLVPLSYKLNNGDQVEILTSNRQNPKEDWLSLVVTGKARTAIKQALKEEKREAAEAGKQSLQRKFKQFKIEFNNSNIDALVGHFKLNSALDLYYQISIKKINPSVLKDFEIIGGKIKIPKPVVRKERANANLKKAIKRDSELLIMGEDSGNIQYSFAKCCNPIPGDDIFGFVSINEGIKIHRSNCPNAEQLLAKYSYRVVKSKWTNQEEVSFLTAIQISGIDDVGVVNNITNIITGQLKLNMRSLSFDSKDGIFEGNIMIFVHDTKELASMIKKLKSLDGVLTVTRVDQENIIHED